LDGLTLLHIGDLHTRGFGPKEKQLQKILEQSVDIIICSGDFCFQWGLSNPFVNTANHRSHDVGLSWTGFKGPPNIPVAKEVVRQIFSNAHAPLGIFAIQGNHDPDVFMPHLSNCGIRVLNNETIQIETKQGQPFNLFGMRCLERAFIDIPATLLNLDPDLFTIGSCHYPEMAEPIAEAGIDLNLAGHTHGGQICCPGGKPILTLSITGKKYVTGLNWIGAKAIYTTRGIGYSMIPVRLFCPPEVVRFTLKQGPSNQTTSTDNNLS